MLKKRYVKHLSIDTTVIWIICYSSVFEVLFIWVFIHLFYIWNQLNSRLKWLSFTLIISYSSKSNLNQIWRGVQTRLQWARNLCFLAELFIILHIFCTNKGFLSIANLLLNLFEFYDSIECWAKCIDLYQGRLLDLSGNRMPIPLHTSAYESTIFLFWKNCF